MLRENSKIHLPELDLLRGFAALFMVVNHIGAKLLNEATAIGNVPISTLLFLTSFAPVLFFFSSGVGSGIQSVTKSNPLRLKPTLYKFTLLMIGDAFFAWGTGRLWGFDFLGFIAVIVLLIELVRCSKFAKSLCVIGVTLIFAVRFGIGPQLNLASDSTGLVLANWLIGFKGLNGSSYPFSPWFTYPLIGFILGAFIANNYKSILVKKVRYNAALFIAASIFSMFSYYLYIHEYIFHRWGTMSFAFYCLSFAVIPFAMMAAYTFHHVQIQLKLFYLSGTASLAIVPIHYYLIYFANDFNLVVINSTFSNNLLFLLILLASFTLAKLMDTATKKIQVYVDSQYSVPSIWLILVILGLVTYELSTSIPGIAKLTQALGQLTICILFSLRFRKKPTK